MLINLIAGVSISAHPDASGLPGSHALSGMVNGLFFFALLASLAAVFIGVVMWGVAGHGNNPHHAARGKMAVLIGGAAAFVTGAAPALITFFANHGQAIK